MNADRIRLPNTLTGEQVIARIREQTDTVLLSFSCGKDSIAAWLALRPTFKIVPFYLYLVPGLEFVEESLAYYEKAFGCRIWRMPHPSLYRMLGNLIFQPPQNCQTIEEAGLPTFDYDDVSRWVAEDSGLPADTWYASGVRASDSPNRRTAIRRYGPITERKRVFYPVWDWTKAAVVSALYYAGLKVPVDYQIFGRSFDGLDYRFLAPIKKHFPRDYQRILELFPLAELELKRAEYAGVCHA